MPHRRLLTAAALVYAVVLPAVVFLPLPDPATCVAGGPPVQLTPVQFLADIVREQRGSGWAALAGNPAVQGVLGNIALFVPFGLLVRALGGVGVRTAVGLGAAASLLVELTQLTGLWGLAPCAYRIVDVDDLLTNTTGALLGACLATLLVHRSRSTPPVGVDRILVDAGPRA